MNIAWKLHRPLDEVMAMSQDEFARWTAFFKMQDDFDKQRHENLLRALGAKL